MASLLEMIKRNRPHMADGGLMAPIAARQRIQADRQDQTAQVENGAFSTTPPPPAPLASYATQPGAVSTEETEMQGQGQVPRLLQAGLHDVGGGVDNAIAAAAQAVGQDNISAAHRRSAQEHAQAADRLAYDQIKQASDIKGAGDILPYAFGQAVRGLPSMGAMALGGGLAKSAGMGAMAGIAAPSAVMNIGGEYGRAHDAIDQQEQSGAITPDKAAELRHSVPVHAAVGGALGAALDTLAFGYVLKANPIAKGQLAGLVSKSLGGHTLRSLAVAGGDAAARERVDQIATQMVLQNPDAFHMSDEDRTAMLNSAAGQAAAMAPFAVPGHFGHAIGTGIDKTFDAAGKIVKPLYNRVRPGEAAPAAPAGEPAPSMGTKVGNAAAALVDGDSERLRAAGGAALDTLKSIPGVSGAMEQGSDFLTALNSSRRVGKMQNWLGARKEQVEAGFNAFKEGYGVPETANIESARERYGNLLAQALGAQGLDSSALARMSGEKLNAFISGFNEKLPTIESTTGALFNTAKGAVGAGVDATVDAGKSFMAGRKAESAWNVTHDEITAGLKGLAQEARPPGTQASYAGSMSHDAHLIRSALLDALPRANAETGLATHYAKHLGDATLLARRLEEVATRSPGEFDRYLNRPDVATTIAHTFDMSPQRFKAHIYEKLQSVDRSKPESQTPMWDALQKNATEQHGGRTNKAGELYDASSPSIDHENLDSTRALTDIDTSDVLREMAHPNETGVDNPHMDAEAFGKMLLTDDQRAKKHTGNRMVNVTETTTDAKTGEVTTKTTPKEVNLMNVATTWQERSKADTKRGAQQSKDDNFKQGLAALLNGWTAVDEHGNHTEVKVQPASGRGPKDARTAVDKDSLHGWLTKDATVGYGPDGKRTFGDVEKAGRANQPHDVPGAIEKYHRDVANAAKHAEVSAAPGTEEYTAELKSILDAAKRKSAGDVAKMAVEKIRDGINDLEPKRQEEVVQAAIDFASDPHARPIPKDVPSYLRMLPAEVLEHGRPRLIAELSDLETDVVQPRLRGEHESSVDNPEHNAEAGRDAVTEDMAGDHINYQHDQEAGAGQRQLGADAGPIGPRGEPPRAGIEGRKAARNQALEDSPRQPALGLDDPTQPLQAGMKREAGVGTGKPGDKPYAEASRTPAQKEAAAESGPLQGKLDVSAEQKPTPFQEQKPGRVTEPPKDRTSSPQQDAMRNLQRMYARATTETGRALLERAMNRLKSASGFIDADLAKMAGEGLKPSDIKTMLDRPYSKHASSEGASAKKAEPAAAPAKVEPAAAPRIITREYVRANPDTAFLFGDNTAERGLGGQAAAMRGEPNAYGVPTKKLPSMNEGSFFSDAEFAQNKAAIDAALAKIPAGKRVVVPQDGLGTGRAQLEQRAPKTYAYLQEQLAKLSDAQKSDAKGGSIIDSTDPVVQQQLVDAVHKIAGDTTGVAFDKTQAHPGQYENAQKLVTFAVTKTLSASTAAHEAFHHVYENYLPPEARATLHKAFREGALKTQVRDFLKDSPEAWQAAKDDPRELAAYAYQAWAAGELHMAHTPTSAVGRVFRKMADLYNKMWDWLRDQPNAETLMNQIADGYFANGGPSPAEIALAKSQRPLARVREVTKSVATMVDKIYDSALYPFDTRVRDWGNPHTDRLAKQLYTQVGETPNRRGLVQEMPIQLKKHMNSLDQLMRDPSAAFKDTLEAMSAGETPANTELAGKIRGWLDGFHKYMTDAGVDVGYVKDYVPMSWDGEKIGDKIDDFKAMLGNHEQELKKIGVSADEVADRMAKRGTATGEYIGNAYDKNGAPEADHTLDRVFGFLSNAERKPFMKDDLAGGLMRYVKQGVNRAEWARRFGDDSSIWNDGLAKAKEFGMTKDQQALLQDYKDAAFGAKLHDMNPTLRKVLGANTVYQNYRVLGLSVLSNLIDPFGVAVRSGEWSDAFDSYKMAVGRIFKSGKLKTQDLQDLGEMIGVIERTGLSDTITGMYGGVNIEGQLKSMNNALFNMNGMNGLTRSVRLAALSAGMKYIERHASRDEPTSKRNLAELGLTRDDVKMVDGQLQVEGNEKVERALNRFVDEAAMHPNAGERTAWGANPVLAPLYHLKQYTFSFNKVINKKLEHELLEHGNITPYMMAACYVPIMAGTAMLKDMILHGGTLPEANGFWHYMGSGVARSGLMGPSDLAELAVGGALTGNLNSVRQALGPTADQVMDAVGAIGNPHNTAQFGKFVRESLPFGSVLQHL